MVPSSSFLFLKGILGYIIRDIFVFRFSPGDTNSVLREFEKCGVILKHIPGPRDANWMHILYQAGFPINSCIGSSANDVFIAVVMLGSLLCRTMLMLRRHSTRMGCK